MKSLITLFFTALIFTSCIVETVEPRYDSRDRIVGYYDVEEYSETYNGYTYYSLRIYKSHYAKEIYLDNFYAAEISIYASVDYDKITIPYQFVEGYEVEGVGTIIGNEIEFSYRVKDRYNNTRSDFCETVARFDY
jgi:hypothetical protein